MKRQTRFVSRHPAKTIIANIEAVAESESFKVRSQNYKVTALVSITAHYKLILLFNTLFNISYKAVGLVDFRGVLLF